jgi:hypothetical protein
VPRKALEVITFMCTQDNYACTQDNYACMQGDLGVNSDMDLLSFTTERSEHRHVLLVLFKEYTLDIKEYD